MAEITLSPASTQGPNPEAVMTASREIFEISPAESKGSSEKLPRPTVARAAEDPRSSAAAPDDPRVVFLQQYQTAISRPVDPEEALTALKVRHAAEEQFRKDYWSRFTHRLPWVGPNRAEYERLFKLSAEELIAKVKDNRGRYNRTILTNVAVHHLMQSANFDVELYRQGIADAGKWEGVHSTLGRAISVLFSAASFGTSQAIQSTAVAALNATRQAVKVVAHVAPTTAINPPVTGVFRIRTEVKESLKRKGGGARLAENIENASPMAAIRKNLIEKQEALIRANEQLENCLNRKEPVPAKQLDATQKEFCELFAAQKEVKTSFSAGKEKTWSKGWGMAVNALSAAGIAAAIPAPIATLAIQAACIPLQWLAGRADEKTKHAYRWRANVKCGDILREEARFLPLEELRTHHIDEARLRGLIDTFAETKVQLVREVYKEELGKLVYRDVKLKAQLDELEAKMEGRSGNPKKLKKKHRPENEKGPREIIEEKREELREIIEAKVNDTRLFESFDAKQWESLDRNNTIGKCLGDERFLEKQAHKARRRKPGEQAAQILQRYSQAFQGLISIGVTVPITDILANIGPLSGHDASATTRSQVNNASIAVSTVGGVVFTASTGEVRLQREQDKKKLAEKVGAEVTQVAEQLAKAKKVWTLKLDEKKELDLTDTGAFDKYFHTVIQRMQRLLKVAGPSLFSGPIGLGYTLATRPIRQSVKGEMARTLELLKRASGENISAKSNPAQKRSFRGMMDEFERSRKKLEEAAQAPGQTQVGAAKTAAEVAAKLRASPPASVRSKSSCLRH